jgi:hypothetical protein
MISEDLYNRLHAKVPFGHKVEMTLRADVELSAKEIERWLEHCYDPEVLEWLARRAKRLAEELRSDDYDDFRSRA